MVKWYDWINIDLSDETTIEGTPWSALKKHEGFSGAKGEFDKFKKESNDWALYKFSEKKLLTALYDEQRK